MILDAVEFLQLEGKILVNYGLIWTRSVFKTELQKPRQRVSNADRKVFANPESFCDKFIIG